MNLTSTSKTFKTGIKVLLAIVFVYYIVILYVGPASISLLKKMFPPKDTSNPSFGLLVPLEFEEKPINGYQPNYVLNTKNGHLPFNLPYKMTVYKIIQPKFSYLGGKNAQTDAGLLGFSASDLVTDLKGDTYKWRNINTGSILEIQTDSRDLIMTTNLTSKASSYPSGTLDTDLAKQAAVNLFRSLNRFNDDFYPKGTQTAHLGRFYGNQIIETTNTRESQIAIVDLFRSIGKYKIVGPDPSKGLLHVVLRSPGSLTTPLNYPITEAYYHEIVATSDATYALISVDDAWNAVKEGNGVITNVTPKGANPFADYLSTKVENILIDNVYVAYYETPKIQKYLQPIYVFEGKYTTRGTDGGYITIYFPAIKGQYIGKEAPIPTPTPTPIPSTTPQASPTVAPSATPTPIPPVVY
jgi:hypothetical protein